MSDNGFVYAFRRAWSHPVFRDLLDAGVWNYLYQNAAWRDETVTVNGFTISLTRGQIFLTLRSLAEGFCCDEKRIRRLISRLTDAAMIAALTTHRGVLLTICNYEEYQRLPGEDAALTPHCPPQNRRTLNKEEGNRKNNTPSYSPEFEDWYRAYPLKKGKQKAYSAYLKALGKVSHDVLMATVRLFAAECIANGTEARYIAHPSTWLNDERWQNSAPKPTRQSWG